MSNSPSYEPHRIEQFWQQRWKSEAIYEQLASNENPSGGGAGSETRTTRYVYAAPPFTTGRLHLGHVRSYTIADAYARFLRAKRNRVLFSIGFDSFGLPNEIAAIQNQMAPRVWVDRCIQDMTLQFERLGCSINWSRAFDSSHPDVFRWSQWSFLKLFEHDFVYRANGFERWCETCQTVLAALQVNQGRCWRCENETRFIEVSQWYLRLSALAEELDRTLDHLHGWDETMVKDQRALLGRMEGVETELRLQPIAGQPDQDTRELGDDLTVFAMRRDDVKHASFVAISPDHPTCSQVLSPMSNQSAADHRLAELHRTNWERSERNAENLPVVQTDWQAVDPSTRSALPVLVSPFVGQRFGVGAAVFGIPQSSRADRLLAERLHLDSSWENGHCEFRSAVRYRCHDFSISRDRFWGAPIPMVNCDQCGAVPVDESSLPIELPPNVAPSADQNPLRRIDEFKNCACPRCGVSAQRETQTLDSHVDALWHIVPSCVALDERTSNVFANSELRQWLPASQVICGGDQAKYMLSYRFFFLAMARCGYLQDVPNGSPAERLMMHGMVLAGQKKMSKHLGNVVDPDELIDKWGTDALRVAILNAAKPRKDFSWNPDVIRNSQRFLDDLWKFVWARRETVRAVAKPVDLRLDTRSTARAKLEKWLQTASQRITSNYDRLQLNLAVQNLITLFDRLKAFDRSICHSAAPGDSQQDSQPDVSQQGDPQQDNADRQALALAMQTMLRLMEPIAPHIAEELWKECGGKTTLAGIPWPEFE